jgi:hypothetical protein
MKKFLALGYMLALPLVSGAKILPSVMYLLFFSVTPAPAGIFAAIGLAPAVANLDKFPFSYFISGFFPTTGGISNFIMGL